MEFLYRDLSEEEQAYINNLLGYKCITDLRTFICSTKERIYRITIQWGHPDPDINLDDVDFIIYKDYIIRLRIRYMRERRVHYSEIFVPKKFKNEEARVIQIIKETEQLLGTSRGYDPDKTVIEYVNGIPIKYYNEEKVPTAALLGGLQYE